MTVKEFLNDVRRQHARVEACKERLKEIECEVISLKSPQLGDKIQSNSVKSLDEVICRLELKRAKKKTKAMVWLSSAKLEQSIFIFWE